MDHTTAWQNNLPMPLAENESAEAETCVEKSDKQLVALILAGDESAFEQLFERYKRFVAAIALRYFQHPEQVEEIIQISFTKAYFELKDFRGNHDFSLPSWLGRIATNASLDMLRSQKRKAENLLCELAPEESENLLAIAAGGNNAEKSLIERDLAEKLLACLPAEDRAILQMLGAEELSVGAIKSATR